MRPLMFIILFIDLKNYTLYDSRLRDQWIDPKTIRFDQHFFVSKSTGKKNKWIKHRVRWTIYRLDQNKSIETLEEYISSVRKTLGDLIKKETPSYFYIQSPYQYENTASMAISKTRLWLCKCFSSGKSINFYRMWEETNFQPYEQRINKHFGYVNIDISSEEDLPF